MRGFPGCSLKILYLLKLYSYMVLNLVYNQVYLIYVYVVYKD